MIMSHFVENVKEPIKIGHGYFMRTTKVKPDGQRLRHTATKRVFSLMHLNNVRLCNCIVNAQPIL